ncbi:hypothetical protein PsYK624_153220 [Phanerochaete sordida]|uniref:Uncharacterized protein n=1 Tax=Phanerochaete sordida TaxID=48140 RepID=A0A9P3GQ21_9APHY|nr:hypothetical protein PsYK624_153220 [Phanerochaete sordida]
MSKAVVKILSTIITGAELAGKVGDVAKQVVPAPSADLKDKHRWVQCTVKNETQFDLLLEDTYFDSGRYWTAPGGFSGFAQMVFSCCNGDNTVLTGVSGGCAFRISLDDQNYYDISLGWTNPELGAFKAGVVQSAKGVDGYNAATPVGAALTSDVVFQGKDKDGNPAKFRINVSAAPGQETLYVVKQILVA